MIGLLAACAGVEPRLPAPAGAFAPSHLAFVGDAAVLADTATCAGCHPDQAAEWAGSAHAHASFDNPWYRASVEALRTDVGYAESRHCGGCHDPVLLVSGAMDGPVDPADPGADAGVTCLTCHGATAARADGNASLTIDLRDLPDPRVDVPAHRARMRSATLDRVCATCHRGFLGPETGNRSHLVGMDDAGGWRTSAWSGDDAAVLSPTEPARATCAECHFADHRALGAHTPITGDSLLPGAAEVLVAAVWVDGRPVAPGAARGPIDAIDVVVWNTGTGHAFPGGTKDLQDTWVDLTVTGAETLTARAAGLRAVVVRADGTPEPRHVTAAIAAAAVDQTVPPGGARALRFTLPSPAAVERIEAVLRHRRHPPAFQAFACAASSADTLDGCAEEPVTVVDADSVAVGAGEDAYERAYVHALALSGEVGERTDDARPGIDRALALASDDRERAAALAIRAAVEARQGRLAAARTAADQAEALVGPHPALERIRGDAAARVWDWASAAAAYARATALAPTDVPAWRGLAQARGSLGDAAGSLDAAASGLAFQPRDPDLLRSQALALRARDDPRAEEAFAAWDAVRPPDDLADLQLACARDPACARLRAPVPVWPVSAEGPR